MDGKICIWNEESLMREKDIKDPVKGGIVGGLSMGDYLVVSGSDLITKVLRKEK